MDITNYIGKFIENKKIKNIKEVPEKTFLGNDKVIVKFDDDTEKAFPLKMLDISISDKEVDLTKLTEKRIEYVVPIIMGALTEAELTKDEIAFLLNGRLQNLITQTYSDAADKLFGKKEYDVTLLDLNNILIK